MKNKPFLLGGIIGLSIAIGIGFYYFIYPVFRVVEIYDQLPDNMINNTGVDNGFYNNKVNIVVESIDINEKDNKAFDKNTVFDKNAKNIDSNLTTYTNKESVQSITYLPAQPIVDTTFHPATGTARLILTKDRNIVRFENYKTIDGPDVKVYLSKTPSKSKDSLLLGDVKGNKGNINYDIPNILPNGQEIDFNEYKYAVH